MEKIVISGNCIPKQKIEIAHSPAKSFCENAAGEDMDHPTRCKRQPFGVSVYGGFIPRFRLRALFVPYPSISQHMYWQLEKQSNSPGK